MEGLEGLEELAARTPLLRFCRQCGATFHLAAKRNQVRCSACRRAGRARDCVPEAMRITSLDEAVALVVSHLASCWDPHEREMLLIELRALRWVAAHPERNQPIPARARRRSVLGAPEGQGGRRSERREVAI